MCVKGPKIQDMWTLTCKLRKNMGQMNHTLDTMYIFNKCAK